MKCVDKPLVVIRCIAYNQAKYIRQTLDGFVMQQTDFRFVAVVHDDASTDGTAEIIREYAAKYPEVIIPVLETENQYSKPGNQLGKIMEQAVAQTGAKYLAYCEGDDYWIDPRKLQKQVDFLESHPDFSMACTNFTFLHQQNGQMQTVGDTARNEVITFDNLMLFNSVATLTVVLRMDVYLEFRRFVADAPRWTFGDYPTWLYAASKGKIMKFGDVTAVYRVLASSASHLTNDVARLRWARSEFSMLDYFAARFDVPEHVMQAALMYRCNAYGELIARTGDRELTERLKRFYAENRFYIARASFEVMRRFPAMRPFTRFVDRHLSIKAPTLYFKLRGRGLR